MRTIDMILDMIEKEHPYKVPGDRDSYDKYNEGWSDAIDRVRGELESLNSGWIPVEDERLWNILFEEACVEGEQERRIYNRLKETFGGERSDMDGKL